MKVIHAAYHVYREADGTLTKDKFIRCIMDDGFDTMILARQFFLLKEYLDAGKEVFAAPEPEVMQVNLDMVAAAQAPKEPDV